MSKTSDKSEKTEFSDLDLIPFIRETASGSGVFQNFNISPGNLTGRQGTQRFTIASADLLTCRATPYQFISDPLGAKDYIQVKSITAYMLFNSVAYTGGGALTIRYASAGPTIGSIPAALINTAATDADTVIPVAVAGIPPITGIEVFNSGGAEYTLGDSDLTIEMEYRIIDFS